VIRLQCSIPAYLRRSSTRLFACICHARVRNVDQMILKSRIVSGVVVQLVVFSPGSICSQFASSSRSTVSSIFSVRSRGTCHFQVICLFLPSFTRSSWPVALVVCSCHYLVLLARTILGCIFSALEFVATACSCWNSMLCPCFLEARCRVLNVLVFLRFEISARVCRCRF
jgi:hypothetical protein